MNSANHVMLLGDLLIWYYEDLAGIRCAPGAVAYEQLEMAPIFPDGLDEAAAVYESVYGPVVSARSEARGGGEGSWVGGGEGGGGGGCVWVGVCVCVWVCFSLRDSHPAMGGGG